ncbi:hypothetical protein [Lactococcus lactis]|uniref:hypothetical protein n=1 Tax=Lactococcus lactis TaxID=1358 RepID=UPI00223AE08D|nr:hypothetical protein [Lactococcus lactis]
MKKLFTAPMSKSAVPLSLILLLAGFLALSFELPIIAPFSLVISTLIFGFLHLPTYDWNFAQVIFIIAAARIPLILASLRSDSLYTGLLIPITYEWIIFILVILSHH